MWLKYKHKWAHGPDKNWTYRYLGDKKISKDEFQCILDEVNSEFNILDHYRGTDYHKCKCPPKEILLSEMNNTKFDINELEDYWKVLKRQISEKYSK